MNCSFCNKALRDDDDIVIVEIGEGGAFFIPMLAIHSKCEKEFKKKYVN